MNERALILQCITYRKTLFSRELVIGKVGKLSLERMTSPTDLTPPPAGACSSAECDKDSYITQLIRRLETLHMSTVVNTPQASLLASISNAQEQEPPICCSQTKSSKVLKQHNTTQMRMLSHRWHRLGLQPPILRSTQEHMSDHYKSTDDTRPALEHSPLQVTLTVSSRNKRTDEMKTISNAHCSSLDTCNRGLLEGNVTEQCFLNYSSRTSVECEEDSDLSDLEKDNIPVLKWAAAVELDLRPDSVDRDLELTEAAEEEQVYPEVLPVPLKDFSESSDAGLERKHPCLTAMVTRLLELEKLQASTIQKEQGKAVRSRPATALVRSANRLRRLESPCSQMEHLRTRGSNSALADFTKLTLSSSSRSRSRQHTRPLSHSDRVRNGVQQAHNVCKKTNSSTVKLRKTEGLANSISNASPKCNSANASKIRKPTTKDMPKSKKTLKKTCVPLKICKCSVKL